jgi:hypothetical protein
VVAEHLFEDDILAVQRHSVLYIVNNIYFFTRVLFIFVMSYWLCVSQPHLCRLHKYQASMYTCFFAFFFYRNHGTSVCPSSAWMISAW